MNSVKTVTDIESVGILRRVMNSAVIFVFLSVVSEAYHSMYVCRLYMCVRYIYI